MASRPTRSFANPSYQSRIRIRLLKANGLITVQLGPDQNVAMLSLELPTPWLAPDIESVVGIENHCAKLILKSSRCSSNRRLPKNISEQRDRVLNRSD